MKWVADVTHPRSLHCVIERQILHDLTQHQDVEGYYLYVYEDDKDIYDGLQDTLEWAINEALEEFSIPKDAWKQIE